MPSLCSPPVTCLTAAVQIITTSWRTSSCEFNTADFYISSTSFDVVHEIKKKKIIYISISSRIRTLTDLRSPCGKLDKPFSKWSSHEPLSLPPLSCRYMVSSLEMLVAEDYLIIYMNGATPRSKMPGISWLKKCYQMIDRRWGQRRSCRKTNCCGAIYVHYRQKI